MIQPSKKIKILFITFLLSLSSPLWAARIYVTDTVKITLRTGPSMENKIIRMLPSGTPLTIIQGEENGTGKWMQVATQDGQTGWVLKQYTMNRLPAQTRADSLQKKLDSLQAKFQDNLEKLKKIKTENNRLSSELQVVSKELNQIQTAYNNLKKDAANVFKLKKEHDATVQELQRAKVGLKKLALENKTLRSQSERNWFLAGAGVVGFSLLFGFILGRIQRKKSKRIYY